MERFKKKLEELKQAKDQAAIRTILSEIYKIGESLGMSDYEIGTALYMSIYGDSQSIKGYKQGRQFFSNMLGKLSELEQKRSEIEQELSKIQQEYSKTPKDHTEKLTELRKKQIDFSYQSAQFELALDDDLRLPEWSEELRKLSFPLAPFPLPRDIMPDILNENWDGEKLQDYCASLQKFLDTLPKKEYPGEFFFKVGSISPKGGADPFGLLAGIFTPENTLNFKDAGSIIKGMINSLRVHFELEKYHTIGRDSSLIIRPFLQLKERNEFRVFVFQGTWIGTSQMFTNNGISYSYTELEKKAIIDGSKWLVEQINPNLEKDSYVIDMYLEGDLESPTARIIELNPFAPITDPILFKDEIFDCSLKVVE